MNPPGEERVMTLDESIQGLRLRVMRRAEQVGNVSQVCREFGISRTLFYRWRRRVERYGVEGLHPRRTQARRGRPVQVPPATERLVQSVAISAGTWGCSRITGHLAQTWQRRVAQYRAADPAPRGPGHPAGTPGGARAAGRPDGGAAHRADPASPVARSPRPDAAPRSPGARRARMSRHVPGARTPTRTFWALLSEGQQPAVSRR